MLFTRATYIGVDPSRGKYAVAFAALDADLKLLALGCGPAEETLAFLGGQRQAVVAVNAPQKLSRSRVEINLTDDSTEFLDCRLAEAKLIEAGYDSYQTPASESKCKPWARLGFEIYEHICKLGYNSELFSEQTLRYCEAQSNICYHAWIGKEPMHKYSLEGRIQRQIVLRDLGLPVDEPMNFFEELTRFRLLKGELPDEMLQSASDLDALALAYLAWNVDQPQPGLSAAGTEEEGLIYYPEESLGEYRGRY